MKTEYDLSQMKSRKNPYASKLKNPMTMRLVRMSSFISKKWQKKTVFPIKA